MSTKSEFDKWCAGARIVWDDGRAKGRREALAELHPLWLAERERAERSEKPADEQREPAPVSSLPDWSECNRIIENYEFRQRADAGLEGQVLDTATTTPEPTELHRFIYEYNDADSYTSAWFLHRLEKVIAEASRPAPADNSSAAPSDLTTVECPDCHGSGEQFGSFACEECSGQGKIIVSKADMAALAAPSPTGESLIAAKHIGFISKKSLEEMPLLQKSKYGACPAIMPCESDVGQPAVKVFAASHPSVQDGVVEGWKLVPIKPTEDQLASLEHPDAAMKRIYSAMLAAAPTAPQGASHDE